MYLIPLRHLPYSEVVFYFPYRKKSNPSDPDFYNCLLRAIISISCTELRSVSLLPYVFKSQQNPANKLYFLTEAIDGRKQAKNCKKMHRRSVGYNRTCSVSNVTFLCSQIVVRGCYCTRLLLPCSLMALLWASSFAKVIKKEKKNPVSPMHACATRVREVHEVRVTFLISLTAKNLKF